MCVVVAGAAVVDTLSFSSPSHTLPVSPETTDTTTTTTATTTTLSMIHSTGVEGRVSFGSILEGSLCRQQRVHAWCDSCSKFTPTVRPALPDDPGVASSLSPDLTALGAQASSGPVSKLPGFP